MDENILRNEVKWEYAKNNLQLCSQRKTDELEEEALFNTEEKFIEAFKKRYNYDDIDEKYFNNKEMKEKIKEYVENNTKGFELEGVEFCDEDYEFVEKLIAEGKSLEDACDEMMQGVRDCLDEGLEETDIEAD